MNKIIRKMSSIAAAALMTASISLTASAAAANTPCIPHTSNLRLMSDKIVSQETHKYLFAVETNIEGVTKNVYRNCTVTVRKRHWAYICTKCGATTHEYDDTVTVHSAKHS